MNNIRYIVFLAMLMVGCSLFRDPRANCNHPKHEEWIREQNDKKLSKMSGGSKTHKRTRRALRCDE